MILPKFGHLVIRWKLDSLQLCRWRGKSANLAFPTFHHNDDSESDDDGGKEADDGDDSESLMMTVVKTLMMLMFTCSHLWHTSMATPNSDQVKKRKI